MPVTISVSKTESRFDSQLPPVVTVTDAGTSAPYNNGVLKVEDWLYIPLRFMPFTWYPPNRTKDNCVLQARKIFFPFSTSGTLVYGTGVIDGGELNVERESGEGWNGAYWNTALSTSKCAVEGKATSFTLTAGISLQSGTINHDYTNAAVEHSILYGQQGVASIRELGVVKKKFSYAIGDKVMIERIDYGSGNVIVRYYKITPDNKMEIIRSTRSKLTDTATIKAEAMVYHTGARVDEFGIFNNEDAATFIKLAGVLENFQGWENELQFVSSGDSIQMADSSLRWSYANRKQVLRGLQLTRTGTDKETERDLYVDFFNWHKNEKPFIFVDYARKENGEPTEWWARFASPFSDKTRNGCRFQNGTAIIEDFRDEFIKKELDIAAPAQITGLMAFEIGEDSFALSWEIPTDNVEVVGYQLGIDGVIYPIEAFVAGDASYTVTNGVDGITINPGTDYQVTVRAYDAVGNFSIWAEEITVHTIGEPDTTAPTAPGTPTFASVTETSMTTNWTAATDNVAVTGYELQRATNSGFTTGLQTFTLGNVLTHNETSLSHTTTYYFRVRARDAAGNWSAYSATASQATAAPDTEAPTTPVLDEILGEFITHNSIENFWSASTDNVAVTGYQLQRAKSADWTVDLVIETLGNVTTFESTGLDAETEYFFRVRAFDAAANYSAWSNTESATTDAAVASNKVVKTVELYPTDGFGGIYSANGTIHGSNTSPTEDLVLLGTWGSTPSGDWRSKSLPDNVTEYQFIVHTGNNGGYYNMSEMRFKNADGDIIPIVAVTASNTDPSYPASNTIDGNTATMWQSNAGGAWIAHELDLS